MVRLGVMKLCEGKYDEHTINLIAAHAAFPWAIGLFIYKKLGFTHGLSLHID
jgi:hypothetical protein